MRKHFFLFGVIGLATALAHGQAGERANPSQSAPVPGVVPRLPMPTGSFGIGRVGYDWTDTARPDRFSADAKAHRELMVYLWYPTAKAAEAKGAYLPGAQAMDKAPAIQNRMREEYGANWPLLVSGAIFSHAVDGAAVAKSPKQFPLILLSHGLGGSGFGYTALIEDLVSHGYVVATIEHTETAGVVAFPDGRLVPFHEDQAPPGLSPAERWKRMVDSVTAGITEGAGDVRFVLDRLTELNAGDARSFPLAGRLDLNRVAAMGHSAGAEFAALACEMDARFKACVDLDGGMVPIAALPESPDGKTMQQPLLFLEAFHPESNMGGTHEQHLEYFKKREAQLEATRPGTFAVVLHSAGIVHGSFSDDPFLEAGGQEQKLSVARHNLDLIEEFVLGYLDRNFKGDRETLFDRVEARPADAEVQAYGH
jgi:dienelactone hydrolase